MLLASEMLRTVKLISDHLHDMAVDTKVGQQLIYYNMLSNNKMVVTLEGTI